MRTILLIYGGWLMVCLNGWENGLRPLRRFFSSNKPIWRKISIQTVLPRTIGDRISCCIRNIQDQNNFFHTFSGWWPNRDLSNGATIMPIQSSRMVPLKEQCHEIFPFWFFSWISFPQSPDYTMRAVSNFFENSRRYSQLKVCHRCQRHRWQMQKIFIHKSINYLV